MTSLDVLFEIVVANGWSLGSHGCWFYLLWDLGLWRWRGGGEECAAGGHEKLVSDCFAVSANDKEVFNNSALNSFTVTYWPIKVFSFWHC